MQLKLLIIDDEPGMRHGVAKALRQFSVTGSGGEQVGFAISEADSGERGIELMRADPPDVVLLDYKLGGMTGLEVLETVRQRDEAAEVIMITAFATIEMAVRATKDGAYDFLAKPFTPRELRAVVGKAARHVLVRRRAKQLAEEKRRVRFEFIRVLGHELKAPLSAVESYLEIMKSRSAGTSLSDYDTIVQRCLTRTAGMRKLILDLLDMTRIEAGEKRREVAWVDVEKSARAALDAVAEQAEQRGITLSLSASGDLRLWADAAEIDIVFNNLSSNAVKYNRERGEVELTVRGLDDRIEIEVRDSGIGLTGEEAGKLFADFVRIKNTDTRKIPGSGLGLSIVKKIAEIYRGEVSVQSERGVGSTFFVSLARCEPGDAEKDGAQTDDEPANRREDGGVDRRPDPQP